MFWAGGVRIKGRLTPGFIALTLTLAFFAVVLARNAWVTEDAYITFRTVDNFLHGYGLRWNVAERVQAYTNPLWMFVMAAATLATGEVHFTSMILSLLCTLLAVLVVVAAVRNFAAGVMAVLLFAFSKAFVDFSVSGLEDPLTHLLLALFFFTYVRRRGDENTCGRLFFIAACATVNRLDTILLLAPVLALVLLRGFSWKKAGEGLAGFFPLFAWESFSLLYYGFPFPNTAYAKLVTGLPRADLIWQGLFYLAESISRDPLTLSTIVAALLLSVLWRQYNLLPLASGVLVYLVYIVWVGGDFMSGRFLTAPFFIAVFMLGLLARAKLTQVTLLPGLLVILLTGFAAGQSPVASGSDYGADDESRKLRRGIADERAHYFQSGGLLRQRRDTPAPDHVLVDTGKRYRGGQSPTVTHGIVGLVGYFAGPHIHIIDQFGIGDPLLARLPKQPGSVEYDGRPWRIGHFVRELPAGYFETVDSGENRLEDANLARYYDKLALITRGPLFDQERLLAIWKMNTGQYDHLLQGYLGSR